MARTRGRRTSRTAAGLDTRRPRPVNPGGPPSDDDRLDASALLDALTGGGDGRHAALCAARIGDHTEPSYDPDRVVRILTALREQLPAEIDSWTHHRISRTRAEEIWRHHLERDDCSRCVDPCAFCATWAEALGLHRADEAGRHVWRPRTTTTTQPRPVKRRRRSTAPERSDRDGS
jgi:hypothetical protein